MLNRPGRSLALAVLCLLPLAAQARPGSGAAPQKLVDETKLSTLSGTVHPLARGAADGGAVADSMRLERMLLVLKRSPAQERELADLLADQQDPRSASYGKWLTPVEFGKRFGPSDADVASVTSWLAEHGMKVGRVAAGRAAIEVSGTAGQLRGAFHTQLHHLTVTADGAAHVANLTDPQIPEALAHVVSGFASLHDFRIAPQARNLGTVRTTRAQPEFTFTGVTSGNTFYGVGPGDFAKIYNVPGNLTGTGVGIAVLAESNIDIDDVRAFRSLFGLPAKDPIVILNGPDPGLLPAANEELEANLDVQWAGAIAPNADVNFVLSESTQISQGIQLSALYAVDNDVAPIISLSFGACESALGTAGVAYWRTLWQQASAQGITVVISTGDSGSGCPRNDGLSVNGIGSSPEVVAIGGTDFDQTGRVTQFWSSTNSASHTSALGYIPERTWNESPCAAAFPATCTSPDPDLDFAAAGGGPSSMYEKPTWQAGITPNDGHRDLPDVSLFAGTGANRSFYVVCESDTNANAHACDLNSPFQDFSGVGGTSAGTPSFAGVAALLNQKVGKRLGNLNPALYGVSQSAPAAFHDVTLGNNAIVCTGGTASCSSTSASGHGVLIDALGQPAFAAKTGYDYATGLGSVDVSALAAAWPASQGAATTTALDVSGSTTIPHGASVSFTVTVTGGTPTGDVVLLAQPTSGPTVSVGPFALASGVATGTTNLLPGGTVQLRARYGGTETLAPSTSAPTTMTVGTEPSAISAGLIVFDFTSGTATINAATASYGAPYVFRMAITNAAGQECAPLMTTNNLDPLVPARPCPSGLLTLAENGQPLDGGNFPLNVRGYAEDQPIQLDTGSHPLTITYSGDNGYNPSTATKTLTITQAGTTTTETTTLPSMTVTNYVFSVIVLSKSNGAAPTGTVQFLDGTNPITATVTYVPTDGDPGCDPSNTGHCAQLTATATLSAGEISAITPRTRGVLAAGFLIALLGLALGVSPSARRSIGILALLLALAVTSGTSCGSSGPRTVNLTAKYSGDTNYATSTSAASQLTIP